MDIKSRRGVTRQTLKTSKMYTVSEYVEFTNNQEISKSRLTFYDTRCTFHEIRRSNQSRFNITSYKIGRNVIRNRIENQHKRSWKVQFAFPDECHHLRLTLVFTYIGSFSSSDTSSCEAICSFTLPSDCYITTPSHRLSSPVSFFSPSPDSATGIYVYTAFYGLTKDNNPSPTQIHSPFCPSIYTPNYSEYFRRINY